MKTTTVLSTKVHKYTRELLWWMQLNYLVTFSRPSVKIRESGWFFGRYSLPSSLKRDTWTKGQKGKEAQKTIKAGQQNRGWVVVVGGQNAWEEEKIFLAPKQTRGGRCRDYFKCHGCYSQSYDILSTQRFTSWLSDIIQVFASTPFVTSTWRNHQEIILWEKKRKWS